MVMAAKSTAAPLGRGGARPGAGRKKGSTTKKRTAKVDDYQRYLKARADKEEHTARLKQMQADEAAGALLPADEVEQEWRDMIATIRAGMLALPSRVAPLVVGIQDEKEIEQVITNAVHDAMSSIAKGDQ